MMITSYVMKRMSSLSRLRPCGLLLVAGVFGCSSPSGPLIADEIAVASQDGQFTIRHLSSLPVYVFVIGRGAAAYTDWVACTDDRLCPPIPPGDLRLQPKPPAQVGVIEREALVYWWLAVVGIDGQTRPDSIRVRIVPL